MLVFLDLPGYPVKKALDGDLGTRIAFIGDPQPPPGQWFAVDMGDTYRVEAFVIYSKAQCE